MVQSDSFDVAYHSDANMVGLLRHCRFLTEGYDDGGGGGANGNGQDGCDGAVDVASLLSKHRRQRHLSAKAWTDESHLYSTDEKSRAGKSEIALMYARYVRSRVLRYATGVSVLERC